MAVTSDPPKEGFRLGMLLYDTRYRSLTIQIVALVGFMLGVGWLASNALANLAALGKPLGFRFLWDPAGYDINQRLIEYTSQSPHWKAALVGLLNTLLVAFLGCILATVIGVVVGVLRLSNNWLIARLMTIYVEAFRNVPVLLWIVFAMAIFIETLPTPRAFRGDNATASMYMWDSVALTNRGWYAPAPVFNAGSWLVVAVFIASLIGIFFFGRWARARQEATGDILPTFWIKLALFVIPALTVFMLMAHFGWGLLFLIGFGLALALGYFAFRYITEHAGYLRESRFAGNFGIVAGLAALLAWFAVYPALSAGTANWAFPISLQQPELAGFNFKGGIFMRNSLIALWLALSFYTAAFIAEIVRAGILSVSKGQTEAAFALGIKPNWTMNLIILPQALRVIIPPLISNYLNLTKNSSLAIAVGYMDVTGTLGGITLNQTGREMETLLLLMLCYLVISLSISFVMNVYNERTKMRER